MSQGGLPGKSLSRAWIIHVFFRQDIIHYEATSYYFTSCVILSVTNSARNRSFSPSCILFIFWDRLPAPHFERGRRGEEYLYRHGKKRNRKEKYSSDDYAEKTGWRKWRGHVPQQGVLITVQLNSLQKVLFFLELFYFHFHVWFDSINGSFCFIYEWCQVLSGGFNSNKNINRDSFAYISWVLSKNSYRPSPVIPYFLARSLSMYTQICSGQLFNESTPAVRLPKTSRKWCFLFACCKFQWLRRSELPLPPF